LGRLYAAGTGVPKDYAEARKWLEQAERGGVVTARELLDWMEKKEFDANEKINAIRNIYNKLNIKNITINTIEDFYQSAIDMWNEIDLEKERKAELLELAQMIMDRDH